MQCPSVGKKYKYGRRAHEIKHVVPRHFCILDLQEIPLQFASHGPSPRVLTRWKATCGASLVIRSSAYLTEIIVFVKNWCPRKCSNQQNLFVHGLWGLLVAKCGIRLF